MGSLSPRAPFGDQQKTRREEERKRKVGGEETGRRGGRWGEDVGRGPSCLQEAEEQGMGANPGQGGISEMGEEAALKAKTPRVCEEPRTTGGTEHKALSPGWQGV